MTRIRHHAWAIAQAKCSGWVENEKYQKGAKNYCLTSLKMLCAKNRCKKHLLLEKSGQFENGQNRSQCMGYSPCKMLSLGQKLKMPKMWEKRFYDHIEVVVCKKPL